MHPGPLIDCDVHHTWARQDELHAFMPAELRTQLDEAGFRIRPASSYPHTGGVNKRLDAFGPAGEPPGSQYEVLRDQLLDPFGVSRAVLSFDIGHEASHPNPHLGAAIARAANDWSIATWLDRDPRLHGAVIVANQFPEEAAREIRRVGGHPRMSEVLLVAGGLGMPLGHPVHHPIYEAAEELGLPVAIHVGAEWLPPTLAAGGLPGSRFEYHTLAGQSVVHHVTSFVTHGVFERFPRLRVLLVEIGLSWLPWLMWTLDAAYPDLRRESPWVRRLPSEYFREHVWITTQPLEMTERPEQLTDFLSTVEGVEDMLCFASDYPHWDTDELLYVKKRLPAAWHDKVFYENACRLFDWSVSDLPAPAVSAS
jgi:predicted TIM-barrel fold metal-dependent hydrolase